MALGLTLVQIEQILMSNTGSGRTRVFRVLVAWRDTDREATVEKLITVLTKFISTHNVNLIREIFESSCGIAI